MDANVEGMEVALTDSIHPRLSTHSGQDDDDEPKRNGWTVRPKKAGSGPRPLFSLLGLCLGESKGGKVKAVSQSDETK